MGTILQTINSACRKVQLIGPGHSVAGTVLESGAAEILNTLLSLWGTQGINVSAEQGHTFDIYASTGQYSVGAGGTINMARPASITKITLINAGSTSEWELCKLTDDAYESFPWKNTTNPVWGWHYRNTAPRGVLSLVGVPSSAARVVIYAPVRFTVYAPGDSFNLPDGYEEAIRPALALRLLSEFAHSGAKMDAATLLQVKEEARWAKGDIQRLNFRYPEVESDFPGLDGDGCGGYCLPMSSSGGSGGEMQNMLVTGDIDGTNDTFTLNFAPSTLILLRNGITQLRNTYFTLSGSTIVFEADYIPQLGDDLWAYGQE